jgi:transketolase
MPTNAPRIGIEAAISWGWERYIGERGAFVGMHGFGASAPGTAVYKEFGITPEAVVETAHRLLTK